MKHTPLLFLFILFLSAYAFGATYTVTRTDDRNEVCNSGVDCSLREAVKLTNASIENDVIDFKSDVSRITLVTQIIIFNNGTLTIAGNGARVLTISGNLGTRIFRINSTTAEIKDLTLTEGYAETFNGGGAMFVIGGSVTLNRVTVTGNTAPYGVVAGGAYFTGGTHYINNSTFSANSSGGNSSGGAIYSASLLIISNSTFSGNRAGIGGAIFAADSLRLQNVTVTNNQAVMSCTGTCAGSGGGIALRGGNSIFFNSIIAGNSADCIACSSSVTVPQEINYFGGQLSSAGNNAIGDNPGDSSYTGTAISYQPSDLRDTDLKLSPLQNNGGDTDTHALLIGSPAIDKGSNSSATATDQRGFARIVGGTIDIGAYESNYAKTRKRVRLF